ncbi:MAG TPA: segregation/condensation protein A [Candidatus Eisenbacteria bacterium]|jgi:segregation and condensation protein A|nr:segregation/condensation protein A [Candidatus Eisenbacteria bacterium]
MSGLPPLRPSVEIKLEKFEGPLDLLLHLIQRDEVDIYDIPIAHITQQFLRYLEMMRLLDLEVSGEFLVMAATLMRIKARMLLPQPTYGEEEEKDPREELVQRLLEYRQYKEAADGLKDREARRREMFERGLVPDESEAGPLPLAAVSLFALLDALDRVLARLPERNVLEMTGEAYDIEDKMGLLLQRTRRAGRMSFTLLLEECRSRIEAIVTLLALLELLKMARLRVEQGTPFGEIWVEPAPDPGSSATSEENVEGAPPATETDPPPKVRRKQRSDDATG